MNLKNLIFIICGAAVAGLVCILAGLIVFLCVQNNIVAHLISLFAIFTGVAVAGASLLILCVALIYSKVKKNKNN